MIQYNQILLRPGEIFLKGGNRPLFERKLINNIKNITHLAVKKLRFRFITDFFPEHKILKYVFGLTSYSPAVSIEYNLSNQAETALEKNSLPLTLEKISEVACALMQEKTGTFKVETKRSDKTFPHTSPEINRIIGEKILDCTSLTLNFKDPDHVLYLEINTNGAYLFTEVIKCFGGLPTGVEGRVLLLLENQASLLAGLLFMKRGCHLFPLAYSDKQEELKFLQKFSPQPLKLKRITENLEIENYAQEIGISTLVLGQNFAKFKKLDLNLLLFRPLIAYSEQEITEALKKYHF